PPRPWREGRVPPAPTGRPPPPSGSVTTLPSSWTMPWHPEEARQRRLEGGGYRGRMSDLTLLHNPKCSTSRAALETLEGADVEADVVQYLKEPLDEAALRELL